MQSRVLHTVEPETTGRFIVTFREGGQTDGLAALRKGAGLGRGKVFSTADFGSTGVDLSQIPTDGAAVLEQLGIAVLNIDPAAAGVMALAAGEDSSILAIEPEGVMYASGEPDGLPLDYLRGFRDAASTLYETASQRASAVAEASIGTPFSDSTSLTWGLQATKGSTSAYTGQGIKLAVLDTGLFLAHPDFAGRPIVSRSFIPGVVSANDGHGHGTHCTGTACGPITPSVGPRYGLAHKAQIHIGKVLSDQGSGADGGILAGIAWALANKCVIVSMSLSAPVSTTSVAYETAGQRALNAGCLIVAAAGNGAKRSSGAFAFVERPANSRSFVAVAALDSALSIANFSARDTVGAAGTAVDIGGPGVAVYSSWPMPKRYNTISGTSMATPHVAGVAALWAEKTGARGAALWQQIIVNARSLSLPIADVGRGLVQAP